MASSAAAAVARPVVGEGPTSCAASGRAGSPNTGSWPPTSQSPASQAGAANALAVSSTIWAERSPAATVRAVAAGLGWAGSAADLSGGTAAWSAATIDGGSAYQGPCAVSPVRGGGATVNGTVRLSQPRARGSMAARAVMRADSLPERAISLLRTPCRCCRPRARRAAARGNGRPRRRSESGSGFGPGTVARRSSRRPRRSARTRRRPSVAELRRGRRRR